MIKKALLTALITLQLFGYEIVIDKSLTKQEMNYIYTLLNSNERVHTTTTTQSKDGFVLIKRGSFMMGSNSGEADEKPVHKVKIDYNFYIGKYEVTVGEFRKFIDATGYKVDTKSNGGCWIYDKKWQQKSDASWKKPYFLQTEQSPVVCVSHNDTKAYTKWISKKEGTTYRLPTEAEWEYVARAGTTTKYSFGSFDNRLGQYAWYSKNSLSKTHKVGQKNPNRWGVYDMHGNVWEWCEDWYVDSYKNTPRNGSDNDSKSQNYKVLRGGSWFDISSNLRSPFRVRGNPAYTSNNVGFRVVSVVHP